MAKKCPVCGMSTYEEGYDREEWEEGQKFIFGSCSYCGFIYEEGMGESLEEQIESYREHLMRKGIECHRKELYR